MPILESTNKISSTSPVSSAKGSIRKRWRVLQMRIERARDLRRAAKRAGQPPDRGADGRSEGDPA